MTMMVFSNDDGLWRRSSKQSKEVLFLLVYRVFFLGYAMKIGCCPELSLVLMVLVNG